MKNLIYHHRTQAVDAQGIHIREISDAFARQGWEVVKVALVDDEAVGKESREEAKFQVLSLLPAFVYELLEIAYNFVGFFKLFIAVRKTKAAFIYERYSIFNVAGVIVAQICKVPLILEVNAPLAEEKKKHGTLYLSKLAQLIETWVINNSYKTITVTNVLKEILVKNGALQDKIITMHNGINCSHYENVEFKQSGDSQVIVGFIGWFRAWHGLKELIVQLKNTPIQNRISLLLVGDGPARKEIERTIFDCNAQSWVSITGAVGRDKVLRYLQQIDIALQPASTDYASPMKLIEYMAASKAIIAPDQPNIRELLDHNKNALLFEPGNWKQLTDIIHFLCDDIELRDSIGREAKLTVKEKDLTWDANVSRILDEVSSFI